eukprot:2214421-Rhodomonas_salina.1
MRQRTSQRFALRAGPGRTRAVQDHQHVLRVRPEPTPRRAARESSNAPRAALATTRKRSNRHRAPPAMRG